MPRSLVTGGAGFIGRALVTELLKRGDEVRVFDIAEPLSEWGGLVEHVRASITDSGAVRAAMRDVDRLYHLAAIPDLWLPDKRRFREVNTAGTKHVLDAAGEAGVRRIVHTSTESIIRGVSGQEGVADECAEADLEDMPGPYCRSKYLAEQAAFGAAAAGLPVVIVNPTLPIGPGDERLTPPMRMLLGYVNGEYPAYLESTFNMIDVRDVAHGHVLAAERGQVGRRYILGGQNLTLGELLDMLHELTGLPMPRRRVPYPVAYATAVVSELVADHVTHRPPAAPLTGVRLARRAMTFDNRRARQELGLRVTPLRKALTDTVRWFEERGLLTRKPRWAPHLSGPATNEAA